MDFKKILCALVFFSGLLVTQLIYAENPGNSTNEKTGDLHKRHAWEEKTREIYSQLNLTDEQKNQLEENKKNNRDQKKALYDQMRSLKDALNQELMKPELNMDKVNEIRSQVKALQTQISDDRLNSILEVRKILTPEQFTKFNSLMEERKHKESSAK